MTNQKVAGNEPVGTNRPAASALNSNPSDVKVDDDSGKTPTFPWSEHAAKREMNTENGIPSGEPVEDPALVGTARALTSSFETSRSQADPNKTPAV